MRYQEQLVKSTQRALEDICRAALALPPDRVDWSPGGEARSALDQMREIATAAAWFVPLVKDKKVDAFAKHPAKEPGPRHMPEAEGLDSLAGCIAEARRSTSELCKAISDLDEERLEEEVALPVGGGMMSTLADVIALHHWNIVYHLGQINQIALMLGDREMH